MTLDLSRMTETFDDEFNTFSASPTGANATWKTTYAFNDRTLSSNGELEYYSDSSVGVNPFSDANGILTITAAPGSNALGLPDDSGEINTQASFSQTYGYFEIRAELPAGDGLWPAFWMVPENNTWPPELDVFEMYGANPDQIFVTSHADIGGVSSSVSTGVAVPDTATGFHTYGVLWTPTTITWYFDGNPVAQVATPADMDIPMYMIANLAVASNADATTPSPAQMQIDDIRAYAYNPAVTPALAIAAPSQAGAAAGKSVAITGISLADPIATAADSVTVTLADSTGTLAATAVGSATESGGGTAALTIAGDFADVDATLALLRYTAAAGGATQDLISIAATDSEGGSAASSLPVALSPVAPPVLSLPAGMLYDVIGAITPISGVSLADPGAPADEVFTVVLTHTLGGLASGNVAGLTNTITTLAGVPTETLSGTLAAVQAGLAGLRYLPGTPGAGVPALQTIRITATDAFGNSTTATLSVTAVAQPDVPPVLSLPAGLTATTTGPAAIAGLSFTDTDPISAGAAFTLVLTASSGTLATTAAQGVVAAGEGQGTLTLTGTMASLDAALATLCYTAAAGATGDAIGVSLTDIRGGSAGGTIPVTVITPIDVERWGMTVTRGAGNYLVTGAGSGATVSLGDGRDSVTLSGFSNDITLGNGNQSVSLAGNSNTVVTGTGTSTIDAGVSYSHVTIGGTPTGTSVLLATGYADVFVSTASGNVSISGTLGQVTVNLAAGNDSIVLGGSQNSVSVGLGTTTINAGTGQSVVHAAGGADTITVGGYDNLLDAGPGNNVLNGGRGDDTFMLNGAGQGLDTINGFVPTTDLLNLQRTLATCSAPVGAWNLAQFVTSSVAGGNTTLSLDPTGGAGTPVAFAVLDGVSTSVAKLLALKAFTGLDTGTASLGGQVFLDANGDGVLDAGDAAVAGVTVTLLTAGGAATGYSTVTSATGAYAFAGLAPGGYIVAFTAPAGDSFDPRAKSGNPAVDSSADPATGMTAAIALAAGQAVSDVNAGMLPPPGAIAGAVFLDANADGMLDGGESGVSGVVVQLLTSAGVATGLSTTTTSSGAYSFTFLLPGSYELAFTAPAGDSFDPQGVGGLAATESSPAPATGITGPIAVAAGQTVQNVNAGLVVPVIAPAGTLATPIIVSGWGQTVSRGNGSYAVTGTGSGAHITLGNGSQSIDLTGWGNTITLGDGNATLLLSGNSNVVTTGSGTSTINAGVSYAHVTIGATPSGTTTVTASGYADVISATGAGNVAVSGTLGQVVVTLQDGNDTISLGGSQNTVTVGVGTSTINTGIGQSVVHAGGGADTITVGGWDNLLDAGPGTNLLNGGNGNDTFMLNGAGQGIDTITHFVAGNDILDLTRTVAGLGASLASLGQFVTSGTAGGSTTLLVDPTGGHGTPDAFAVLQGVTTSVSALIAGGRIQI